MDTQKTELEEVVVEEMEKNQNVETTVIAGEDEDDVESSSSVSIDLQPAQSSQSNASVTKSVKPYMRYQVILYKDWVGVITDVGRDVWYKADGGPHFSLELFETRAHPVWSIAETYPGQRTRIASSILKGAKYFGAFSNFFSKFLPLHHIYSWTDLTVVRTEVVSLDVKWLQRNPLLGLNTESDKTLEPPQEVISKDEFANVIVIGVAISKTTGPLIDDDDDEFPPGMTVSRLDKDARMSTTYGIVMDSSELAMARTRKINVRWIVDGVDTGFQEESVFEIKPHPEYSLYHRLTIVFPRGSSPQIFKTAEVVDVNMSSGKMVVFRDSNPSNRPTTMFVEDHQQQEVYPHEVIGLANRCYWNYFTSRWDVDEISPPPYQLQLEYDPVHKIVDVNEENLGVLMKEDPNNPIGEEMVTTLLDEPTFETIGFAPKTHRYYDRSFPNDFPPQFAQSTMKEWEFLQKPGNVTEGIWLRCYENRMDLMSVLMVGPTKTPYEDGLLVFDMQLLPCFPASRPSIHFVSYTLEIHPLLGYDGNVCSSMIPWYFPDNGESPPSYIMYFLSTLQELLFTPTPYFASPQKKSEEGTAFGRLKSELYNEGVFVRVLDSIWNMLQRPHAPWEKCIQNHFASVLPEKLITMEKWMNGEVDQSDPSEFKGSPTIHKMQITDGLRVSLNKRLAKFHKVVKQCAIVEIHSVADATADSESSSTEPNNQFPVKSCAKFPIITTTDSGESSESSTFVDQVNNNSSPESSNGLHGSNSNSMVGGRYIKPTHV